MEESKLLSELIIWGVGFIVFQIVSLVAFVIKMNVKLEKLRTQMDEYRKNFDLRFLEIETDMEDHKIAYENRIKEVSDSLCKHYDNFHKENHEAHNLIMKAVEFIKNAVTQIQENVAYMSGTLDMHISNGNGHDKRIPPKRRTTKG